MNYSLIIPIYNEEKSLTKLIKKLNLLDNKQIEVIIIDDGSNDGTNEILRENNQFKIKRNKFNLGKGASIIKGAELASNQKHPYSFLLAVCHTFGCRTVSTVSGVRPCGVACSHEPMPGFRARKSFIYRTSFIGGKSLE